MSRWKLDSDALPGQETCLRCGGLHYGSPRGVCVVAPDYVPPKPWPKESRVIVDRMNHRHLCHICDERTELKCSDCAINLKAEVYVCENPKCRDEHEKRYCSGPNRQVRALAGEREPESSTKEDTK